MQERPSKSDPNVSNFLDGWDTSKENGPNGGGQRTPTDLGAIMSLHNSEKETPTAIDAPSPLQPGDDGASPLTLALLAAAAAIDNDTTFSARSSPFLAGGNGDVEVLDDGDDAWNQLSAQVDIDHTSTMYGPEHRIQGSTSPTVIPYINCKEYNVTPHSESSSKSKLKGKRVGDPDTEGVRRHAGELTASAKKRRGGKDTGSNLGTALLNMPGPAPKPDPFVSRYLGKLLTKRKQDTKRLVGQANGLVLAIPAIDQESRVTATLSLISESLGGGGMERRANVRTGILQERRVQPGEMHQTRLNLHPEMPTQEESEECETPLLENMQPPRPLKQLPQIEAPPTMVVAVPPPRAVATAVSPESDAALAFDSALMYDWTSTSPAATVPSHTTADQLHADVMSRHQVLLDQQAQQQEFDNQRAEALIHSNFHEDARKVAARQSMSKVFQTAVLMGGSTFVGHSAATAMRVAVREDYPSFAPVASPLNNFDVSNASGDNFASLQKVLNNAKSRRRQIDESSSETIVQLLQEGFHIHRLFSAELQMAGMTCQEFCVVNHISAHHLTAYLCLVQSSNKNKALQLDTVLKGVRGADLQRVHRNVCQFVKTAMLKPKKSHDFSGHNNSSRQGSSTPSQELMLGGGAALRQQWRAAAALDGLNTSLFCELFQIHDTDGFTHWLANTAQHVKNVERVVTSYLEQRENLRMDFMTYLTERKSSVHNFAARWLISLSDLSSWLSESPTYDRTVVARVWRSLIDHRQAEQKTLQLAAQNHQRSASVPLISASLLDVSSPHSAVNVSSISSLRPPKIAPKPLHPEQKCIPGILKDKFVLEGVVAHIQLSDEEDNHRAAVECRPEGKSKTWRREYDVSGAGPPRPWPEPTAMELFEQQRKCLLLKVGAPMSDGYWRHGDPWAKAHLHRTKNNNHLPAISSVPQRQIPVDKQVLQLEYSVEPLTFIASPPDTTAHLHHSPGHHAMQHVSPSPHTHSGVGSLPGVDALHISAHSLHHSKVSEASLQQLLNNRKVESSKRGVIFEAIRKFPHKNGNTVHVEQKTKAVSLSSMGL